MPRFVILQHDHPHGRHYDFMLEIGDVLRTWSLAEPPTVGVEQPAKLLFDHRIAYLDYEGPVSGDRGTVRQWDRGTYSAVTSSEELLIVELRGDKIRGQVGLVRESQATSWKLTLTAAE
jgi:hypothetical protein